MVKKREKKEKKKKKERKSFSKGFNLREEFDCAMDYLNESRKFIYIIMGVFFFSTLVGFFIPAPESISQYIFKIIKEVLERTQGMSTGELISFIFFNNLQVSFLCLVLGIAFGLFPIVLSISNGYLIGFVANWGVKSGGFSSLWMLLPHGIFELPAVFISFGLGLRLGVLLFGIEKDGQKIKRKQNEKRDYLKNNLISSLKVFIFTVIPLLIIAAIIEGFLISLSG